MRSRLLNLTQSNLELTNERTIEQVNEEIHRYSRAIRDYRAFREEGQQLFASIRHLNEILPIMRDIEILKSKEAGSATPPGLRPEGADIRTCRQKMDPIIMEAVQSTTSGLTATHAERAKTALWARLSMALGGGFALIGPMLIMVLHPTRLTALLTTSCCVVATAISLAVFMVDSAPKDIVACTAAYAAVLAVFVGAGGGTP